MASITCSVTPWAIAAILRAGARKLSQGVFHKGEICELEFPESNEEAEKFSYDLVGTDPARQQTALAELEKHNVTIEEVIVRLRKVCR